MNDLQSIRDHYQVPAKQGGRITYGVEKPVNGTIIGGKNARLRVRLDGGSKTVLLHPTWEVRYHREPNVQSPPTGDKEERAR